VPLVLVGLVNWNEVDRTLLCIERIGSDAPDVDVVVVDNGSAGDDVARLRERLGRERVLDTRENRGYAGGMNGVLRHALGREDVTEVLLLTPDVDLDPDALAKMLEVLRCQPTAGVVGPVVIYRDEPRPLLGAGGTVEPGRVRAPLLREPRAAAPYAVDWIDGCCMLLRREAIAAVGGFDERFFIYFEETDFCERMRRAGWSIWVAPEAKAHHPKGDALPPAYYFYYMARNRYLFWHNNFDVAPGRVALELLRETALLCASALRSRPPLTRAVRARWAARQLAGACRGTIDYFRGRFGRMPGTA